jgi:hypothetical protein
MLTGEQRATLSPAAETALSSGWTPAAPAAFTGANTEGVRSPFAVLTARLSPAELPPPPGRRPARPPWCGQCDQATRMLGFDGDAPRTPPEVKVPADFAAALAADERASTFFGKLSNSMQRYHIDNINAAKSAETRQRRIDKAIALFLDGKQR